MDDYNIVKENDNYRVRLEHDESGQKPYDEGATPILSREFRSYGSRRWEAVNDAGEDFTGILNEIYQRFEDEEAIIERFAKIFLGAYSVEFDSSENNRYVSFDTAEWREKVGLTDEWLSTSDLDRTKLAEGSLTEIISWANGEVYGYIVEKKFSTVTTYIDPESGEEVREEEDEEWIEVEDGSCWGFYGYDYAKEEAEGAFDSEVERSKK